MEEEEEIKNKRENLEEEGQGRDHRGKWEKEEMFIT